MQQKYAEVVQGSYHSEQAINTSETEKAFLLPTEKRGAAAQKDAAILSNS